MSPLPIGPALFSAALCISHEHNPGLVGLAALLCTLACLTTVSVLTRAIKARGRVAALWSAGAALTFGTGVWTTHFVAMLAYEPGLPTAYAPGRTVLSLVMAVVFSLPGFLLLTRVRSAASVTLAALIVAGAVGTMHYLGMSAMLVPGIVWHKTGFVLSSLVIGFCFCLASFFCFARGRIAASGMLLIPAICGLHFIGIAAVAIRPTHVGGPIEHGLPAEYLALTVATVSLMALFLALFTVAFDQRLATRTQQEADRLRRFADATSEGILFVRDGRVVDVNETMCVMAAQSRPLIVGRLVETLFGPAAGPWMSAGALELLETELAGEGGGSRPVEVLGRALSAMDGADTVLAIRDLTARKAAERRIEELANYDALTGLANRRLFQRRLDEALSLAARSGAGAALFCLDLDRFKSVNDKMGHPAGDRLLVQVALRLRALLREIDTAARLGGDEFAVILQMAGNPQASATLAERILDEVSRPYDIDGQQAVIGVSIGIAMVCEAADSSVALMQNADVALYSAKRAGRGRFCFFDPEMNARLRQQREMEHILQGACARGEMELHYQPLCDGRSMNIVGQEALLRWRHPERGTIPPAEFIPLIEENGLIIPIGRWVIEEACRKAASWPAPMRVAVNVSPVQFKDATLVAFVAAALQRNGLAPNRLELEITEGVLIEDTERVITTLQQLKALGTRIVLDDFGTGYSSLSYLRRFPFDKIKIDRSFIHNLGTDPEADTLVGSIVALGRSLQLEVTAEGVETNEQRDYLLSLLCDQLQGYLIGRPTAQVCTRVQEEFASQAA